MQWFRLWDDIVDDPKLLRHSTNIRWVWICIMAMANRSPKRGSLYVSENMPCILDDIVRVSREPRKVVEEAIELFTSKPYSMLHTDENGAWVVTNWEKRQPKKDDVAARMAASRARKKGNMLHPQGVTEGVTGDTHVTPPDTDTDSDTDNKEVVVDDGKQSAIDFLNAKCLNWQLRVDAYRDLLAFADRVSWPVVERAARITVSEDKGINYCLAILRRWEEAGVKSLADAELEESRFRAQREARRMEQERKGKGQAPSSNVILRRNNKASGYYDDVFKQFESGGGEPT